MKQKLRSIIITGNNNIEYRFSGEEAKLVERSFNDAAQGGLSHVLLQLEGRSIILNMAHISEVYIGYDEVSE